MISEVRKLIRVSSSNWPFFAEKGSPGFERFLETLGERIRLKGWDKYRGGLDVKGMSNLFDLFAKNAKKDPNSAKFNQPLRNTRW